MSLTIEIKDAKGAKAGTFDLPAEIFDVQVNVPLIHQVVTAQLNAARAGTAKTKNRGEGAFIEYALHRRLHEHGLVAHDVDLEFGRKLLLQDF